MVVSPVWRPWLNPAGALVIVSGSGACGVVACAASYGYDTRVIVGGSADLSQLCDFIGESRIGLREASGYDICVIARNAVFGICMTRVS